MNLPSEKNPAFSVIIPTCARPEFLRQCLNRLKPGFQKLGYQFYEVIVSDDRPETVIHEMMTTDYSWVRYVTGPARGPAANRNNGAALAKGDWIVFLDDDCLPQAQLLQVYYEQILQDSKSMVLEGSISPAGIRNRIDEDAPINEYGGCLWSCNFCIKKDLFITLRGFDEVFPIAAMEDVDLRYRLKQQGATILFLPKAQVLHPYVSNRGGDYIRTRVQSIDYFYRKHGLLVQISPSGFLKNYLRKLYRSIIIHGWSFRFKGAIRLILLETLFLYESLRQYFRPIFIENKKA